MDTRQIEFTEPVIIGAVDYSAGDRKTFPATDAAEYIRLGWAKCTATGEQGERKAGAEAIQPATVSQGAG